jgi:hypothetical protein
MNAPFTA